LATCTGREGLQARLQIITDVCCALWYLHAQKPQIVHGDLKGSNVLIEQRSTGARAKLLDFGLSRLMTHDVKPLGGTLSWMAPELIKSPTKKPRASADIFSFGRFVHFTVTGSKPFIGVSQQRIMAMAKKGQVPPLNWEKADAMCEKGVAICERCLVYPPSQRLTIAEVHAEIASWSALVSGKPQSTPAVHPQSSSSVRSQARVRFAQEPLTDHKAIGSTEPARANNPKDTVMERNPASNNDYTGTGCSLRGNHLGPDKSCKMAQETANLRQQEQGTNRSGAKQTLAL